MVAETLKLLVASLPCAGAKLGATMSVLLIMLVEVQACSLPARDRCQPDILPYPFCPGAYMRLDHSISLLCRDLFKPAHFAAHPWPTHEAPNTSRVVLRLMLVSGWQVASPEGTPHAALRDLAVKLVTLVASGPSGAAFQAAVAALSPEAKQRLQVRSLRASASGLTMPMDLLSSI